MEGLLPATLLPLLLTMVRCGAEMWGCPIALPAWGLGGGGSRGSVGSFGVWGGLGAFCECLWGFGGGWEGPMGVYGVYGGLGASYGAL